jgi:hypothetical protein
VAAPAPAPVAAPAGGEEPEPTQSAPLKRARVAVGE